MVERHGVGSSKPFHCLLVPTDFSSGADLALCRAARLPLAPKAKVLLVHVLPPGHTVRLRAQAEADARQRLAKAAALVADTASESGPSSVTVESEILSGSSFVEIIRRSRTASADLIVLGRHGHRPIRDMFIGSTAERVVRKGDVPVLVVARQPTHNYSRPLVATDLGDSSTQIRELALRVLGPNVKSIAVVHVYQVPFESRLGRGPSPEAIAFRRGFLTDARSGMDRLLDPWNEAGLRWIPVIRKGDPREAILLESQRRKADLIVLGTHGRSGMSHVLLGSVAEWVIRTARCDVLVSRPVRFSFRSP